MNFIDNNTDTDTVNYLSKSISPEVMEKALSHTGLIQREVQVQGKNGKVFMRKQWVKAGEDSLQDKVNSAWKESQQKEKREVLPATPFNLTEKTKHLVPISEIKDIPEYIKDANIPPDWREVMVSPDPNPESEILAIGKDSQDRPHYIYTQSHWDRVNAEKYQRVSELIEKKEELVSAIQVMKNRDTADCLNLIYNMGLRPGSDKDTKSKVTAYGASTLLGKHVVIEDKKVFLRFIGKKGVEQDHEVTNSYLASMLVKRKEHAGEDGKLFKDTDDVKLRTALKPLGIHPKDLRTMLANVTAKEWLADVEPVSDVKEFVRVRNLVGDAVCSKLGNQRSMSLKSYIDPSVFENWSPEGYKKWQDQQAQKKVSEENEENT